MLNEKTKTIDTTAGKFEARLVVYKDFINSNGKWRLFWEDLSRPGCGIADESQVTGQPFYNTMKKAINRGIIRHGIKAVKVVY